MSLYLPALLLIMGGVLRFFFIFQWHEPGRFMFSDMGTYLKWARQILSGQLTQDHFFQPIGLPLLEVFILSFNNGDLNWLSWIQWFASLGTLVFVWRTTLKLTNEKIALLSLGFASFHYPFIFISGVYLSECLFTFLLSFIIWLIAQKNNPWPWPWAFFIGLMVGLSLWLKGTFALYLPLLWLWQIRLIYKDKTRDGFQFWPKILPTLVFSIGVFFVMCLHGFLSYSTIGEFHLSPTNGGLNFVEGKCPWKKNIASDGQWWMSPLFAQLQEADSKSWNHPFYDSSFFYQQGLQCIEEHPLVLVDSLRYIPYLFINNDFWPTLNTVKEYQHLSRNYDLFFAFWILPSLCFALLFLMAQADTRKWRVWVLPTLTIFCTVWLFKSEIRFRVPFDVVFIPLGVWGWDLILSRANPYLSERKKFLFQVLLICGLGVLLTTALIST